jgi:hypothetical protein
MSAIPLIAFGARRQFAESVSEAIAPTFTFTAVVSEWIIGSDESKNTLKTLIKHLHPPPAGIIVGGGFDDNQKEEIRAIAQEHGLRFVRVPYMYMKDHSPEETLQWCRNALLKEFEVE